MPIPKTGALPLGHTPIAVSYTHLRAHETREDLVCRLLLEKKNDLQESAEMICPKIKEINNFLKRNTKTKLARMTGSGATCFGIYENTNNAKIAEKLLKAEFKNLWIKRTELINQF